MPPGNLRKDDLENGNQIFSGAAETKRDYSALLQQMREHEPEEPDSPHSEELLLSGGRRCGLAFGNMNGWYVGMSPRNGYGALVEGPWEDWVSLAREIIAVEEARQVQKNNTEKTQDS